MKKKNPELRRHAQLFELLYQQSVREETCKSRRRAERVAPPSDAQQKFLSYATDSVFATKPLRQRLV